MEKAKKKRPREFRKAWWESQTAMCKHSEVQSKCTRNWTGPWFGPPQAAPPWIFQDQRAWRTTRSPFSLPTLPSPSGSSLVGTRSFFHVCRKTRRDGAQKELEGSADLPGGQLRTSPSPLPPPLYSVLLPV